MRISHRNTKYDPDFESLNLPAILIRAKYQLWNQEGRPSPDPHVWLCTFLNADRGRMTKGSTNWYKFRKVCKKIVGDKKVKVTKEEVWRHLTLYFVTAKHWGPLSDDKSDASCGHGWEKPKGRACRKLELT